MTAPTPEPAEEPLPPRARGCWCMCHVFPGVKHMTACCHPTLEEAKT